MKEQFLSRLSATNWNVSPVRGRSIIGSMIARLLKSERPAEDFRGNPLPKMHLRGDVAVIPIRGSLMLNVPEWVKPYGFDLTDANDIEQEVSQALNNPAVNIIAQHIDSGGGESMAGEKLFEMFEAANRKKPVMTFTGDGAMCCSAAFQSAAPSTAILCGRFADMVCIGTYCMVLDDTAYREQLGLKWEIFRSGEFKALGQDALTENQRIYLQSSVDEFGARFRAMVSRYRTEADPANMQGQDFRGVEAAQLGFVAAIPRAGEPWDLDAAIAKFRKML